MPLFDDSNNFKTPDNTINPIPNSEKPVAGSSCYVQKKNIIIHPFTEYLSHDIDQPVFSHMQHFVSEQSFKSNSNNTISHDKLSCGSKNMIYGICCVHYGLVHLWVKP